MALEQEIPETLVRAAQQSDGAALSRLLREVRPRVYRWALVQTGSPDEAEDIAQEALVRAARAIGEFTFAARFTTWLHRIVRTTAADLRRSRQRRDALLRAHGASCGVTRQPELDPGLIDIVRDNLAGLTGRQREIFDLVDLQGHTPGETAELLAMNAATVRVHLLRARRTLRLRILNLHPHIVEDMR